MTVWHGATIATIAHAISLLKSPDFEAAHSWDGQNYNVQDFEGSRGTISFSRDELVGAFFLEGSERDPLSGGSYIEPTELVKGAPASLVALAQREAFQYLLQEFDGTQRPVVTAAFWSADDASARQAVEPWESFLAHGGCLVERELAGPRAALAAFGEEFGLTQDQVAFAQIIYERRVAAGEGSCELTACEVATIESWAEDDDAVPACLETLGEVGIGQPLTS